MRLIDADTLIEEIEKNALEVEKQMQGRRTGKTLAQGILLGLGAARKIILDQPVAYDPEKVVDRMEKEKNLLCRKDGSLLSAKQNIKIDKAIQIVKGGGVDGN